MSEAHCIYFLSNKRVFRRSFWGRVVGHFGVGYIVFDVMMLYFADELLVVRTYGRQLCLMLAIYFIGWMICDVLADKRKKVAEILGERKNKTNFF